MKNWLIVILPCLLIHAPSSGVLIHAPSYVSEQSTQPLIIGEKQYAREAFIDPALKNNYSTDAYVGHPYHDPTMPVVSEMDKPMGGYGIMNASLAHTAIFKEQVALLKQDNEVQQIKTQAAHRARNIITAFALILIVCLVMVYRRYLHNAKQLTTIRKQKAQIETHVKEKDLLLSELKHRTKNHLTMIRSLLSKQAKQTDDPQIKSIFHESTFQIDTVALVHEQLNAVDGFQSIRCKPYFHQLIAWYRKMNSTGKEIFFDAYIHDIDLPVHRLVPLGLIANEAITNAIKYAFSDEEACDPKISLQLSRQDEAIILEVYDNGRWKGNPTEGVVPGLIERLSLQLHAEVAYHLTSNGTRLTASVPEDYSQEKPILPSLAF